eukprot:gb/GEZN01017605.1/.p1 GENE.gb/GEZN01017605.1/~~gb/GEZN01017605.1/.p1  ORF type:complete len:121 (+),score=10.18 gb/GEZN01017605.1/:189-551(+)
MSKRRRSSSEESASSPTSLGAVRKTPQGVPTKKRLKATGCSNPCICGCGLDCATNYVVPFPSNTEGRRKMLNVFGLKTKLTDESYWKLAARAEPRVSLLHFSEKQLQVQTRGLLAGKKKK